MNRVMERTPLIGTGRPHDEERQAPVADHPIFLRAAHAPWRRLNQNALGYVRGAFLAYLLACGGMLTDYSIEHREDTHTRWRIAFQFSTVTWALLITYHFMVFSWTITHLHWPNISRNDTRWESKLLRFMSPPEQTAESRSRFYFSLFHTVTHVFALMVVIIYWAVEVPNGHSHWPSGGGDGGSDEGFLVVADIPPITDIIAGGWFPALSIFTAYVFPALATIIESLFLNSMRRQEPVPSHIFGTMAAAALYLGYSAIGKTITGHTSFWWMDPTLAGSPAKVAGYCTGFVFLAVAMFGVLYGLIVLRETLVRRQRRT